jgi:septal ring factor EnvC (AmiA/AmiB activator)
VSRCLAFRATHPLLGRRGRDGTIIRPSREVRQHARHLEQRLTEVDEERNALAKRLAADARRIAEFEAQLQRLQEERGQRNE